MLISHYLLTCVHRFSESTLSRTTHTICVCRFNVQNLNNQRRLYQQGLTPITKTVPGRGGWERLRERVDYEVNAGCILRDN